MVIRPQQKLNKLAKEQNLLPSFEAGGEIIEPVDASKYLVIIHTSFTWNNEIRTIQKKVSKGIGLLKYSRNLV